MRNSAILIAVPVYSFGALYLLAPILGWQADTASIVDWFGSLSWASKIAIKGIFAHAFTFHVLHGVRHLIWDTGALLTNKQVQVTGWATVGATVLLGTGITLWL